MLAEDYLGSFLSYFDLWTGAFVAGLEESNTSVSSFVLVLLSSMASILNLFTRSNQDILFTSYSI